MKPIFYSFAIFALATSAFSQNDATAAEVRLAKLDESYQAELRKVTNPVREKYRNALKKLKSEYTKSGNLEAALAVNERLQSAAEKKTSKIPIGSFPGNLFETPLRWFEDHMMIIVHEDGTVTTSWDGRHNWRQTGPNEISFDWGSKLINRAPGQVFGIDRKGKESKLSVASRGSVTKKDR